MEPFKEEMQEAVGLLEDGEFCLGVWSLRWGRDRCMRAPAWALAGQRP